MVEETEEERLEASERQEGAVKELTMDVECSQPATRRQRFCIFLNYLHFLTAKGPVKGLFDKSLSNEQEVRWGFIRSADISRLLISGRRPPLRMVS